VEGSGEHGLEDTARTSYSNFKELLERNNYKTQVISLLEKPEVPKECTVLIVGGPRFDYVEPAVKAIQSYVESGGRALIMMDPPLRMGKDDVSDNAALAKLLESWGVVLNKDLTLDTSGIGQLFGLGPEVPLVTSYESHAIVREMKSIATALPLARSLEVKSGGKASVEKLFSTTSNSYATTRLNSREIDIDPARDKKGPFVLAAAGTYPTGETGTQGRFVVVARRPGGELHPAVQRKSRPRDEHDELAQFRRGPDLDPSQGAGGPPTLAEPPADVDGLLYQRGGPAADGGSGGHRSVVAEEVSHAHSGTGDRARRAGAARRRRVLVRAGEEG
jgi:hypothetical protein